MSLGSTNSVRGRDVEWTKQARADLAKLEAREADRIKLAVRHLANTDHGNVRRLKGFDSPRIRLRVGSWRVMLEKKAGLIRILRVIHRREAYRKSAWIHQALPGAEGPEADETAEPACSKKVGIRSREFQAPVFYAFRPALAETRFHAVSLISQSA